MYCSSLTKSEIKYCLNARTYGVRLCEVLGSAAGDTGAVRGQNKWAETCCCQLDTHSVSTLNVTPGAERSNISN
jgi:hypothetical protein